MMDFCTPQGGRVFVCTHTQIKTQVNNKKTFIMYCNLKGKLGAPIWGEIHKTVWDMNSSKFTGPDIFEQDQNQNENLF